MKISKSPAVFEPVVITLEHQDEVDALCTVTGAIIGRGDFEETSIREVANLVYHGLIDCGAESRTNLVQKDMVLEG